MYISTIFSIHFKIYIASIFLSLLKLNCDKCDFYSKTTNLQAVHHCRSVLFTQTVEWGGAPTSHLISICTQVILLPVWIFYCLGAIKVYSTLVIYIYIQSTVALWFFNITTNICVRLNAIYNDILTCATLPVGFLNKGWSKRINSHMSHTE